MFKRGVFCVLIALTVGTLSNAGQKSGIDRLDWISGCWSLDDGTGRTEECWMKPAGKSMLGISRTVAGGKTAFTEYLQIREANGQIDYIAAVGISAKPVAFRLIKNSEREAVFENREHDFPQRIIYRRESSDALFARIEGQEKGIDKATDYRYRRAKCD